jgi:outer membrane protein TolC
MLKKIIITIILFFYISSHVAVAASDQPILLSLKEAILLAVRENPSVQQAQLNHIQQKFALEVAEWQFHPHFQLTAGSVINRGRNFEDQYSNKNWGVQPEASWVSPIGTQVSVVNSNPVADHYHPSLSFQVVQPLLRGFGRPIVEASLHNAIDSEKISRLNVENSLRTVVTNVINAYLDIVSAENVLLIDQQALKRAEISVQQTKLFIKAGRKAGVELVTVQADVANAETQLENDKNNLAQTKYALLAAIGIDPSTNVVFSSVDIPGLIKKYDIPSLDEARNLTLANDIQYQIDQITLNGAAKRSVLQAEDSAKWSLNLTGSAGSGGSSGGGKNAGVPSLINGANQAQSVQLNLTIPINDKSAKQAILAAKTALREANIAIKQEKWAKETNAINSWNTIFSAARAMRFAENAGELQQKTYQMSFQKYKFGLIDSVELQSVQQQLIQRQQALLYARISYLKALVMLDQQMGKTLHTWEVQVRYS